MAIQYPFELDQFQKRAVLRLEEDESVFVCAHTSAGKTVIAEYSVALAKKKNRKAIYTSPIKALSNQKYRDFKAKFGDDVGIVTGDVSLNPTASCLIVTTEVLRNMLYKGHDIIRDISWVIFDEVHYVNNQERGVVWEETIIMLPETIGLVMLSATAPNYMDFANWVGRTKKRTIFVQKTLFRPVPLEHNIYIFDQFHVIKEKDGNFKTQEYDDLKNQIKKAQTLKNCISIYKDQLKQEKQQKGIYKNTNMSQKNKRIMKNITQKYIKQVNEEDLNKQENQSEIEAIRKLLYICENKNLLPCVVFVFSKNKIQELSEGLGNISFCTIEEQRIIEKTFNQAAMKINFRDLRVPQIQTTKDLMTRGIAVHHGDVIPFIKEVVEILFSQGLIKVLFATETFAMGINMPTKTVIFHSVSKHDGFSLRMLNSSEYTQMSGRAGRRSLDEKGTVILFIQDMNKLPSKMDLAKMLDHKGELLISKFKITYESIINLMASKYLHIIDLIKKSYIENDKYARIPQTLRRIKELRQEYKDLSIIECHKKDPEINYILMEKYVQIADQLKTINRAYFNKDKTYIQEQLQLPSFCSFVDQNFNIFLGIIVSIFEKKEERRFLQIMYIDEIDSECQNPKFIFQEDQYKQKAQENVYFYDCGSKKQYSYTIYDLSLDEIMQIYDDSVDIYQSNQKNIDYLGDEYLQKCASALISKKQFFKDIILVPDIQQGNTGLRPKMKVKRFQEFKVKSDQIDQQKKQQTTKELITSQCHSCELKDAHLKQVFKRKDVKKLLEQLIQSIDEDQLAQGESLEAKIMFLQTLRYIDKDNNKPLIKGRINKEIQNIYVTEALVSGVLDDLDEFELTSLLSCYVCQGKVKGEKYDPEDDYENFNLYSPEFIKSYKQAVEITLNTIELENFLGVTFYTSAKQYMKDNVFNQDLIKVVYTWMHGADLLHVSSLTGYQEGGIVRCFHRLQNLLKNVKSAAIILGDNNLAMKIDYSREVLIKDIVFQQSLYYDKF